MALPSVYQLPLLFDGKCCPRCGALKDKTAFARDKSTKDGLCYYCRECVAAYKKRHYGARALTEPTIPTEKRCTKCGIVQPAANFHRRRRDADGLATRCRSCTKEIKAGAWRKRTPEQVERERERHRSLYLVHRDEWLARYRTMREQNPEVNRERCRLWAHRNYARRVAYRAAHDDKLRAQNAAWKRANRDRSRLNENRRRVRKAAAEGAHTAEDIRLLFEVQQGRCAYCRKPLSRYVIEHMTPLTRGGSDSIDNLCLACRSCNSRKHTKTVGEFFALMLKRSWSLGHQS